MGASSMVPGPIRRLAEELTELNPDIGTSVDDPLAVIEEIDYALRPPVHERRVPSYGAIVGARTELSHWAEAAGFEVSRRRVDDLRDATVRRLADGIVSWAIRGSSGVNDLVVFDRSVGSERDQTILADATQGVMVQRHPNGTVRAIGPFGVLRHDGMTWHLEPPIDRWLDRERCLSLPMDACLFDKVLRFAVHDVAARRIGATLLISPDGSLHPNTEQRVGRPPEFAIDRPADLAPLYHILGQLDGAAAFNAEGQLQHLGLRLVPTVEAEAAVKAYRGTRHTSALRYSFDDPAAVLVVVSEDGPISVVQGGKLIGVSTTLVPAP